MTGPRRIAVTGAGSGLGRALALGLAEAGVELHLCGRRLEPLEETAALCHAKGARVQVTTLDLRDHDAVAHWVETLTEQPLDLAVLNAGIFDGRDKHGRLETPARASAVIDTNLSAAIGLALGLAEKKRQAGQGTLLLVSSLGAFGPAADAPSYSASKAGLTAFGRALREDLAPEGVRVVLAHPGHLETEQTAVHRGPLPGLMPVDKAAARILRGLSRGQSTITFPRHLAFGLFLQNLLPWRLQARINKSLRFWVDHGSD